MSRGQRRPTSRKFGPHRMGAKNLTNLTNLLLQDIAVFNDYISTKLGELGELTDIETAADLTNESQVKLAKAKLRGLTHTLVTEAINPE